MNQYFLYMNSGTGKATHWGCISGGMTTSSLFNITTGFHEQQQNVTVI